MYEEYTVYDDEPTVFVRFNDVGDYCNSLIDWSDNSGLGVITDPEKYEAECQIISPTLTDKECCALLGIPEDTPRTEWIHDFLDKCDNGLIYNYLKREIVQHYSWVYTYTQVPRTEKNLIKDAYDEQIYVIDVPYSPEVGKWVNK